MPDEKVSAGNGTKAFGVVLAAVALIGAMYKMNEPMAQRIEFQDQQISDIRKDMIETDLREREDRTALATMQERFTEVETQFRDQARRIKAYEEWQVWWQRKVPALDATQNGRIDAIERVVYGNLKRRDEEKGGE